MRVVTPLLFTALGMLASAGTDAADRWIHLRVEEAGGAKVSVNLPLDMIRDVLPYLESDRLRGGRVIFGPGEVAASDVEAARKALSRALTGSRVEVDDRDGRLRIERAGNLVVLTRTGTEGDRVIVRVPVRAAEAALEDLPAGLDLVRIVRAFERGPEAEIARIEADGSRVRIWIDGSARSD